ncbi:MAG: ABC transporter permease [Candidatus Calescibacterium sp.]|nr:ABC transporter permease [Candidatus Calescibacterium sp.]MCX7734098.1 ABC transporter permease [bacterium]MDW8087840.1 ABC transporter permease [Candidatus Calescibacterium sp.]
MPVRRILSFLIFSALAVYPLSLLLFSLFSDCSPTEIDLDRTLLSPSLSFPLGTNELGQNLACMIGHGIITSLKVSAISVLISFVLGGVLGTAAGYMGGAYDFVISRMIEFFQGLPALIFVIFIVSVFGGGDDKIIISLSAFGWVSFARIARNESARIKNLEFVKSAYVVGLPHSRIMLKYIFPYVLPSLLTQAMFSFSAFILAEGGLGFLGLRPAEKISLGSIISDGVDFILTNPRLVIFPGLCLTCIAVLSNIIGQNLIAAQKKSFE